MRSLVPEHARHSPGPPPPFSGGVTPPRRRIPKENVYAGAAPPSEDRYRSPSSAAKPLGDVTPTLNRVLPPRPLKRKLDVSPAVGPRPRPEADASDSGVQVVVRIRPPCSVEGEEAPGSCLCKTSTNSVAIQGQSFTFDAVADAASTQEDFFTLVGPPLVENCLSGLNSSIFTYGQTGSGKTYTMWGPLSAISGDSMACERGLAPRVFEHLFSRIKQEQGKHKDKELICSCTCSFLEIYNEQITDLLDPMQKNLQIREDVKTACVYVESLTKESVFTMKDVNQLLVKGLANRRTGSTSANADSSRSHCVFTCVVKSESKNLGDGSNIIRMSRMNLVDLAGSERQKLTHAAGNRLKEAGNINRSLSALGNLINILAEISQSGKQWQHVPYRNSKLTFLLQESLGGNAMLAMICTVSPSESCKSETLSTLRFAQRAKAVKHRTVVNEEKEDDVNALHVQTKLLQDNIADAADWAEAESKRMTLTDELRAELEASKSLVGRLRSELESEKKCSKEAMEAAMQAYSRILVRYADLEGKYILDGVEGQLKDTSEAPGELLVRLKEAEEATRVAEEATRVAERRALLAEQKMDMLIEENVALNQRLTEK
ncbi:kinesin-like protein KIN-12A [Hordeum vulgare subsp. vulgare]|uniref:Kinesin-like protein n=1 Tax=Hordeum vulgare subsp. vulgare TaxID=112509 RepID=F2DA49_HORVV|nr:kinesin-like protein KIN-12A [Hordeum vulgare subsp. vulgare]BAJ91970.1 predicted protein [Hordeum vulgare subsp. vulgare]